MRFHPLVEAYTCLMLYWWTRAESNRRLESVESIRITTIKFSQVWRREIHTLVLSLVGLGPRALLQPVLGIAPERTPVARLQFWPYQSYVANLGLLGGNLDSFCFLRYIPHPEN